MVSAETTTVFPGSLVPTAPADLTSYGASGQTWRAVHLDIAVTPFASTRDDAVSFRSDTGIAERSALGPSERLTRTASDLVRALKVLLFCRYVRSFEQESVGRTRSPSHRD